MTNDQMKESLDCLISLCGTQGKLGRQLGCTAATVSNRHTGKEPIEGWFYSNMKASFLECFRIAEKRGVSESRRSDLFARLKPMVLDMLADDEKIRRIIK